MLSETPGEISHGLRFIADAHLGKLAKYLRLCGFDTLFDPDLDDGDIINVALNESRIVLSRDKDLLNNLKAVAGYRVLSAQPAVQLNEVMESYNLKDQMSPFSRCLECNGVLLFINREEVIEMLPEGVKELHSVFRKCDKCGRVYWEGTHYQKMKTFIANL